MTIAVLLCSAGLLVWFWLDSMQSRELAISSCVNFCHEQNVQFLDQSVYLAQLRVTLSLYQRLALERQYLFEFSLSGSDRYKGIVIVVGRQVTHLSLLHPAGQIIQGTLI